MSLFSVQANEERVAKAIDRLCTALAKLANEATETLVELREEAKEK